MQGNSKRLRLCFSHGGAPCATALVQSIVPPQLSSLALPQHVGREVKPSTFIQDSVSGLVMSPEESFFYGELSQIPPPCLLLDMCMCKLGLPPSCLWGHCYITGSFSSCHLFP